MITIFDIERGIENATDSAEHWPGTLDVYITHVILPLLDILRIGCATGLKCDPESLRYRLEDLESAIKLKFNL